MDRQPASEVIDFNLPRLADRALGDVDDERGGVGGLPVHVRQQPRAVIVPPHAVYVRELQLLATPGLH